VFVFAFTRKRQDGSAPKFFSELGENTCLLQPVSLHPPGL